MFADGYMDIVEKTLRKAWDEQKEVFTQSAERIRKALETKHGVFIFGCSHAGIFGFITRRS